MRLMKLKLITVTLLVQLFQSWYEQLSNSFAEKFLSFFRADQVMIVYTAQYVLHFRGNRTVS